MNLQQILDDLNALDPQNPGAWPLYVRLSAVVLLAIALLIGGYYFLIDPELQTLHIEEGKESSLLDEFLQKQKKVAALDAYKAQLQEMEKTFGTMLRMLPGKTEVANLLNDISQTRVASSLEEELFKPQSDITRDFYAEIPNQIIVVGTYHEMGGFVSGVAALPRIVTIDDVDIKAFTESGKQKSSKDKKDTNSNDGGVLLRMQALAKTYRYLDDQEMSAQESKKKASGPPKGEVK